jgi:2-dehydro-3-deoxyglucarate aldolase
MVNPLKRKLLENRLTVGSWVTIGHPSVVEVMARAGFDWLTVDLEHSVIDLQTTQVLVATIQAQGLVPLVRVTENDPKLIQRVMDTGAMGVIVPMVNSKTDAELAVAAVRYPPAGRRGVGLARAQGYGLAFESYAAQINHESVVIAQIEHIDGVTNVEEILAVEGIDGVLVGPYDLSSSLGHPGRFDHPAVLEAVQRVEAVCRAKQRPLGFHVIQPQRRLLEEKIRKGYTFLAFSLDTLFLGTACADALRGLERSVKVE